MGLAHAGKSDLSCLPDIDAAIFPAYLEGLAAEDYPAAPAQVRAGYIGALTARSALSALPLELLSRPPGKETEAEFLHRLRLPRAMIDLAAEITAAEPEPATGTQLNLVPRRTVRSEACPAHPRRHVKRDGASAPSRLTQARRVEHSRRGPRVERQPLIML